MTDRKLIIRAENLPTRCEICHQADRFDPASGVCQRCQPVLRSVSPATNTPSKVWQPFRHWPKEVLVVLTLGGVCFLIGASLCSRSGALSVAFTGVLFILFGVVNWILAIEFRELRARQETGAKKRLRRNKNE